MNHNEYHVVGAIYVGTNNLQLTIAQVKEDGVVVILDELTQPTALGNDTFSKGRIMVSTMHEVVKALKGFNRILKEYRVKTTMAISTSAFREADNREYIQEHIRMNTGIEVDVINSSQERYLMYKALRYQFPWLGLSRESSIVINIAAGGVDLSIYEQGRLTLMEHLNIGALRLHEMLAGLENKTLDFSGIMEEFVRSRLSSITPLIRKANPKYFVGLGSEINTAAGLCRHDSDLFIDSAEIALLYNEVKSMHYERLTTTYGLSPKQVETLMPTVILLNAFQTLTNSKRIYVPNIELRHGMLYDIADHIYDLPRKSSYDEDIIGSVWYIANKYGLDKKHSANVAKMSLSIYDKMTRYHQLSGRERQYLHIAAILHTIGYFVDFSEQNQLSYELVRKQRIMGLSDNELDIIANIIYYHGNGVPRQHHMHYQRHQHDEKLVISKLTAILKLADCLNISHNEKIRNVELVQRADTLDFVLLIKEPVPLEEWAFSQKVEYFEEVFGIQPRLRYKK